MPLPKAFASCTSVDPTDPYQCRGLDLEVCYYLLTAIPERHFVTASVRSCRSPRCPLGHQWCLPRQFHHLPIGHPLAKSQSNRRAFEISQADGPCFARVDQCSIDCVNVRSLQHHQPSGKHEYMSLDHCLHRFFLDHSWSLCVEIQRLTPLGARIIQGSFLAHARIHKLIWKERQKLFSINVSRSCLKTKFRSSGDLHSPLRFFQISMEGHSLY